jgi:GNAT superfamily N-acetyltransferase
MIVSSRLATPDDVEYLMGFYRALEKEQLALRPLWDTAEGLPEPLEEALRSAIDDAATRLVIGELDGVPLGFALATLDEMLPQAAGERVVTFRFIFTDPDARGVGIGHAMTTHVIDHFAERGVKLFDARVSPGHRNAKNFFEAHGFSARLIVMHHDASAE